MTVTTEGDKVLFGMPAAMTPVHDVVKLKSVVPRRTTALTLASVAVQHLLPNLRRDIPFAALMLWKIFKSLDINDIHRPSRPSNFTNDR